MQPDIDAAKMLRGIRSHLRAVEGEVLFDPDGFNKRQYNFSLALHRLEEEELRRFAEMAVKIRQRFRGDLEEESKDDKDVGMVENPHQD